ncbi:MAG: histidine kinase, partial [Saprospiraceae bacterium]
MNKIVHILWLNLFLCISVNAQDSFLNTENSVNILSDQSDTLVLKLKFYLKNHQYDQAIFPTIKLIDQSLENEDGNKAHYYRFQLAKIYFYLGWYSNALANLEYCQIYYRQNQNNVDYVRTCHLLSLINFRINNLEMANYFFGQTELEKPTTNNPLLKHEHLMLMSMLKKSVNDVTSKKDLARVIKFAKENNIIDLHYQAYMILGDEFSETNNYMQACLAYQKSYSLCDSVSYLFEMSQLNFKIYQCLSKQELFKEANLQLLNYISLNDTLFKIKQNEALLKSVNKYEDRTLREGKIDLAQDKRLFELKSRRSNFTLIGLLFGIGFILFAVFIIIRFYQEKLSASEIILKQNEQINKQKIKELEQSNTLNNLESMIKGQEEERERIAKDLHDSLGGLLSTIKLRYDKLIYDNNSVTSSPEHHKVHDLIDEACSEIRNIAHDLKPGSLEKLGLIDAIQDMLNRYD